MFTEISQAQREQVVHEHLHGESKTVELIEVDSRVVFTEGARG